MTREELNTSRLTKQYGELTIRCDRCGTIVHLRHEDNRCPCCGTVYDEDGDSHIGYYGRYEV